MNQFNNNHNNQLEENSIQPSMKNQMIEDKTHMVKRELILRVGDIFIIYLSSEIMKKQRKGEVCDEKL